MVAQIPVRGGADVAVGVHGESTLRAGRPARSYGDAAQLDHCLELTGSDGELVLFIALTARHQKGHHAAGFAVPEVHFRDSELDLVGWFELSCGFRTGAAFEVDRGEKALGFDRQRRYLTLLQDVPTAATIGYNLDHEDAVAWFADGTDNNPSSRSKVHQSSLPALTG
jgi:hypothetical protein